MRRLWSVLPSRSNRLTWAFVPERQGKKWCRFPLNWTDAQSTRGSWVTRQPLTPSFMPRTSAAQRAVGSGPEARPGRFHGPYGNFVLCTEKVSDNSDLNCHMWAVNRPEENHSTIWPSTYGPAAQGDFTAISQATPGDFIRFVNELLYWLISELASLEEKNTIFIYVFVKGTRASPPLWGGG